jgi:hypothetical protein
MAQQGLKLKQASAVLQVEPKELQNLVQFGVVKPVWSAGMYFFDMKMLLAAKVALYLKESLGTSTSILSKLMNAFSALEEKLRETEPELRRLQLPPNTGRGTDQVRRAVSSVGGKGRGTIGQG